MIAPVPHPDLRVAILGYGLAGRVFHAPLVAATDGMRVAAIVTSDPARRAAAARDHPGARLVAHADELWEAARELDLVVVATPNRGTCPRPARPSVRACPWWWTSRWRPPPARAASSRTRPRASASC